MPTPQAPGKAPLTRAAPSSLRTQLLITTVLPVTSLLLILSLVTVIGSVRLMRTLIQERDSQLVKLAARQVANYWADSVVLLTEVAANDTIRSGDVQALNDILGANFSLSQRYDEIALTDAQGTVLAATGAVTESLVINQPWIERARRLRRPVLSPVFIDSLGTQMLSVAIPIFDQTGQFTGYAVGIWRLDSDRLGRPIADIRVGEAGIAYLVDSDGMILYHPDKNLVGTDTSQDPAYSMLRKQAAGAQTINVQGTTRVIGYAPIPLRELGVSLFADDSWGNWNLVTSESLSDIVAPLRPYLPYLVLLIALVIFLPLFIILINTRRITGPLQSLAAQAGRVASGEFGNEVNLATGPQEVRELEEAFNTMVEQLRSYRGDIQNYVVSILNSQEQERKRIARDLHDETAQALIVLGRRIEAAQEIKDSGELNRELEGLRDMVDDTLQGVRSFTSDLRPPLLGELGLPRTLQLLGDRTEREEPFTVAVDIAGQPQPLSAELELGLYRLAQESLSNVRRHAKAAHVRLVLHYEARLVVLEVIDDGVGFETPDNLTDLVKKGQLGLMGILERARLFGGRAQVISRPGSGTTIRVVIPVNTDQDAAEPS